MSWFVKYVSTYRKYAKSKKGQKLFGMLRQIYHAELSNEAARMIGAHMIAVVGRLNLEYLGKFWKVDKREITDDDIYIVVYPEGSVDDYVCTISIVRIESNMYVDDVNEVFTIEEEGGDA